MARPMRAHGNDDTRGSSEIETRHGSTKNYSTHHGGHGRQLCKRQRSEEPSSLQMGQCAQ